MNKATKIFFSILGIMVLVALGNVMRGGEKTMAIPDAPEKLETPDIPETPDPLAKSETPDNPTTPSVDSLEVKGAEGIVLRRSAYTLLYDKDVRLPLWVSWHLTREHVKNSVANRKGMKFEEDYEVPAPRATNMDYVNSGYDRGHMCPAGDNKWSYKALTESFLYTNCCPQLHSLNGGDWNTLENRCRNWAVKYGDVYIVCGPLLLNKNHRRLGKNKVVVPEAFYKVVLCLGSNPKAIGFIYRNEPTKKNITEYVNTVDQVERITKLDFFSFLEDDIENEIESKADLRMW